MRLWNTFCFYRADKDYEVCLCVCFLQFPNQNWCAYGQTQPFWYCLCLCFFWCVLVFFNDLRRNIFQSSVCMCTSAVHPLCFPPSFHLWAQTWSSVFLWSFPFLCTDKAVSDNIQGYSWVWAWLNDDTVCVPNASHAVVPVLMNRLVFKRNVSLEFSAVALWNLKVVLKGCVAVSLLALVWLVPCYKVSVGRW